MSSCRVHTAQLLSYRFACLPFHNASPAPIHHLGINSGVDALERCKNVVINKSWQHTWRAFPSIPSARAPRKPTISNSLGRGPTWTGKQIRQKGSGNAQAQGSNAMLLHPQTGVEGAAIKPNLSKQTFPTTPSWEWWPWLPPVNKITAALCGAWNSHLLEGQVEGGQKVLGVEQHVGLHEGTPRASPRASPSAHRGAEGHARSSQGKRRPLHPANKSSRIANPLQLHQPGTTVT